MVDIKDKNFQTKVCGGLEEVETQEAKISELDERVGQEQELHEPNEQQVDKQLVDKQQIDKQQDSKKKTEKQEKQEKPQQQQPVLQPGKQEQQAAKRYYYGYEPVNAEDDDEDEDGIDPQDRNTPDNWVKRSPHLIRLTGSYPMNAEPPSNLLMKSLITPTSLHYVRNHGSVPRLEWSTHKLSVCGMVKHERQFSMDELVKMKSVTFTSTMVCDGNRRKELNMIRRTKGFNWGATAASTSVWTGVMLADILNECGVNRQEAKFVWFQGADRMMWHDTPYETSIPLEVAMNTTSDIIVAYEMNGERLHPDHGFPIRVLLPGMVGGRQVKWLSRIMVSDRETDNYYHWHDNKVLPSNVDFSTVDAGWWTKPEYTLYDLNINSVITHPLHGERLTFAPSRLKKKNKKTLSGNKKNNSNNSSHGGGIMSYTLRGYAYSGGGRRVNRVEVSLDSGKSWELCQIEFPPDSTRHGIKTWVWCHWSFEVPPWKFIKSKELIVRAWDRSCNTQPAEPTWNLLGMMNNCYYRVKVEVNEIEEPENYDSRHSRCNGGENSQSESESEESEDDDMTMVNSASNIEIRFIHPVQPDHMTGGWKDRKPIRPRPLSIDRTRAHYTREEVMKHNKEHDCWIIMDNDVYDVTSYLKEHPGGPIPILLMANGTDASALFREIHGEDAEEIKDRFRIGSVVHIPESMINREETILDPSRWLDASLCHREDVSHDTRRFRFKFANKSKHRKHHKGKNKSMEKEKEKEKIIVKKQEEKTKNKEKEEGIEKEKEKESKESKETYKGKIVGLPVGHHVLVAADIGDEFIARPYTPIHPVGTKDDRGQVELLVKVYYDRKERPGGIMSQFLDKLKIGDRVKIKGPAGHIHYLGNGVITVHSTTIQVKKISMIGGGTGITPLYQIAKSIVQDPEDRTKVALLYSNHTKEDILLKDELDEMANKHRRFTVHYTLTGDCDLDRDDDPSRYSFGFVNETKIRKYLYAPADDSVVLLCGPPAMIDHACIPHLQRLGFNESTIFEF